MKKARKLMAMVLVASFLVFVVAGCESSSAASNDGATKAEVAVEETAKVETTEAVVTTEATVETTQVETAAVETAEAETVAGEVEPFVWQDGDVLSYMFDDGSVYQVFKKDGEYYGGEKDKEPSTHYIYGIEYNEYFVKKYFYDPVYFPEVQPEEIINKDTIDENDYYSDFGMSHEWVDGEEIIFTYANGEMYNLRYVDEALRLFKVEKVEGEEESVTEIYTFSNSLALEARVFIFETFGMLKYG